MQMIINDLSAKFPVDSVTEGRQIMNVFLNTYSEMKRIIVNDSVLMDQNYYSFVLAKDYRIEQWRNDPAVDVENKRRFRSLLNKSVVYDSMEFDTESECSVIIEDKEYRSTGCLLVHETDGVAISFLSEECWREPELRGNYISLDDEANIAELPVKIPNVSCEENVKYFGEKYEEKKEEWRREIRSGQDILKYRDMVFPNLIFCENAINGCCDNVGVVEAGQVYKRLLELQRAAEQMGQQFEKESLPKATPETSVTLEQYAVEHTFLMPDGNAQLFSWHIRFTGGYAGRIFFHPDAIQKKIYVGHIGHKLPTKKYPH